MNGVLYIVGIGLAPNQITQEAIEVLKNTGAVFIEEYTSMFEVKPSEYLTRIIGKPVTPVNRRELEEENGSILIKAVKEYGSAALVTIGDPMIATTHSALLITAVEAGFSVKVINGISIVCSAISQVGLSPYKLGPVATVTYERGGVLSRRAYEVLLSNISNGLHTLLLLDIKDGGGFMSIKEAAEVLTRIEDEVKLGLVNDDLAAVFGSRIGWVDQAIKVTSITKPPDLKPPSIIVVPGLLNPVELDLLKLVHGADEGLLKRHIEHVKSFLRNP
ncbi:diphthine synthase [Caldivirga maquilingensis]|uniref:Diphthine synthase n=1 Tax=Caldivirga maquilingensis (strain ATCC 700844 / DSM 13496 / JCM 10307 / IC-167) TaxID=397948 RepID=A8MC22_CALMQ|nr:diphthine synthase [Caldivirga maquilingensis]ABW02806.1 Diphthine synthase [Caldivirga maquilingensis IC-167]